MCESCWDERGRPTNWNANVQRALALIETIYAEECTGGPMHSVIDDWNLSGVIVPYCPDDFSPEVAQASRELAALFNEMPERERVSTLAYADGFVPVPASS